MPMRSASAQSRCMLGTVQLWRRCPWCFPDAGGDVAHPYAKLINRLCILA